MVLCDDPERLAEISANTGRNMIARVACMVNRIMYRTRVSRYGRSPYLGKGRLREIISPTLYPRHLRLSAAKCSADLHRALDHIDVLKDLELQVAVEHRVIGEEFVDDRKSRFAPLAADE